MSVMVKNKTNKNYKRSQKGRSMVEMLGVLAIVGVLSVGGVYGYGVAMKKHKANELLHQASMLATTISAQIQSKGELPQSIEDFGNGKYGTFNPPNEANAEQFTMQITGMDSAVCEQMEKMSGGMVREAKCNGTTLTLTYNNNLSSDKVAADYNGDEDGCEDSGRKYCDNDTCIPSSEECPVTGPTCPTGSSTEGTGGSTGIKIDGALCQCDDENAVYTSNGCEVRTSDTCDDHTTNQCGLGYYCKFSPSDCSDSDRGDGVCTAISGGTEVDGHWVGPNLDWWSANSWCIGKGSSGSITYTTLQSEYSCNKGYSCDWFTMYSNGLTDNYWFREDIGDSCSVFCLDLGSANFCDKFRNEANYALCE